MIEVTGPNGEVFEFPAGTPPEEMQRALQGYFGAPTAPAAAPPERNIFEGANSPLADPNVTSYQAPPLAADMAPSPTQMVGADGSLDPTVPHAGTVTPEGMWTQNQLGEPMFNANRPQGNAFGHLLSGIEGIGQGAAHMAGAVPDTLGMAANLPLQAADWVTGGHVPQRYATNLGDQIANTVGPFVDEHILPIIPDEEKSPGMRLTTDVADFATQGYLGAGAMGALGAARPAAQSVIPGARPRIGDVFTQPYVNNLPRQTFADTLSGAGAGAGINAAQQYFPDQPWATLMAGLAGGTPGGMASSVGQGTSNAVGSLARNFTPDPNITAANPANGRPFSRLQTEGAAALMQDKALDPLAAQQSVERNSQAFSDAGVAPDQMPTSGRLTDDVGLITAEHQARLRNAVPFVERDQQVLGAAGERVASVRDPKADLEAPRAAAGVARDQQLDPAQQGVEAAQRNLATTQQVRQQDGARLSPFANELARTNASTRLDTELVDRNYIPDRLAKNEAFRNAAPASLPVDISGVATRAREILAEVNQLPPSYRPDTGRFQDFARRLDPEHELNAETRESLLDNTETTPWGPQTWWESLPEQERIRQTQLMSGSRGASHKANVPWDDNPNAPQIESLFGHLSERGLVEAPAASSLGMDSIPQDEWASLNMPYEALGRVRMELSDAITQARAGGQFQMADNLQALRSEVSSALDAVAPGAAQNYQEFAGRYRPGQNDPMAQFTKGLDRDPTRANPLLAPERTGQRFLAAPEKARAIARVFNTSANPQAGQTAVRDYLMSDFASSVMNNDGTINPARATAWMDANGPVLNQFPNMRGQFDGYVASARFGEGSETAANQALRDAQQNLNLTEADINRGAVGMLLNKDPRDVAAELLNGGWESGERATEIMGIVQNDPAALAGWRAAMAEELTRRVTGSKRIDAGGLPDNYEATLGSLSREFKNNEELLAQVFTPEQMQTLHEGQALLETFRSATLRATQGSPTAENFFTSAAGRALELVLKQTMGNLQGGGQMRRFRLMAESLPNQKAALDQIAQLSWFDPDVMAYLLGRPVRDTGIYRPNRKLRLLMAGDAAWREANPIEEEEE